MERPENLHIKISNIPKVPIYKNDLTQHTCNGWVYFKILPGCYGLTQAEKLANDHLPKGFKKSGYYESVTTSGIWRHKHVNDFGIEYVGELQAIICNKPFRNIKPSPQIMRGPSLWDSNLTGHKLPSNPSASAICP